MRVDCHDGSRSSGAPPVVCDPARPPAPPISMLDTTREKAFNSQNFVLRGPTARGLLCNIEIWGRGYRSRAHNKPFSENEKITRKILSTFSSPGTPFAFHFTSLFLRAAKFSHRTQHIVSGPTGFAPCKETNKKQAQSTVGIQARGDAPVSAPSLVHAATAPETPAPVQLDFGWAGEAVFAGDCQKRAKKICNATQ